MASHIGRRKFLATLLGGAAGTWPLTGRAQQPAKTPRVGYIRAGTPNNDPFREEFVRGMRDLGYVEGHNIVYEFRHYGDDVESIPSLINHLLRAKVDIIVAGGTVAVRAAQSATQSIPIVIGAAADPLGVGLVAGLARPGGNTTGFSVLSTELTVKRLELLKEVMPQAARIAILQKPGNPAHPMFIKEIEPTCLFSYSASLKDMWYRSATFVDKILKGAKPADLPVQQGTKFEFVINLKAARALGFDVSPILLARADEVIE